MVFGFGKGAAHREVTAQELDAMVRAGEVVVVDVREVDEFAQGHIPGAINMLGLAKRTGAVHVPAFAAAGHRRQATGAELPGRQAFGHGAGKVRGRAGGGRYAPGRRVQRLAGSWSAGRTVSK